MDDVARYMLQQQPHIQVECAFLELTQPDLATAVAKLASTGVTEIVIAPMFLGLGKHAREDIPQLVEQLRDMYPGIQFRLKNSVGEAPQVIELLARIAMS